MIALLGSVLATSLVGSPHCAGMCGGFALFAAGDPRGARRGIAVASYNLGRLVTYLALGVAAGALGQGLDRLGAAAGIARAAAVVAGVLLIVWGGLELARALGARRGLPPAPAPWHGAIASALRRARDWPPAARGLAIGSVTTLLPCGFLYAFVAVAAGTGAAAAGALVMAIFWLGTVPVMTGLGVIAQRALGPLRSRLPVVTAAALLVIGLLTVAGRMVPVPGGHAGHGQHAPAGATHGGR